MPLVRRPMTSVSGFVMAEEDEFDSMPVLPRQPAGPPQSTKRFRLSGGRPLGFSSHAVNLRCGLWPVGTRQVRSRSANLPSVSVIFGCALSAARIVAAGHGST